MSADERGNLPLTSAQAGIWLAHQLDPSRCDYTIAEYFDIRGEVHVEHFCTAVRLVEAETEILNVRFVEEGGEVRQEPGVLAGESVCDVVDVSAEPDPAAAAVALMRELLARPFDLVEGRLGVLVLYRLGPRRFFFLHGRHHLVIDGVAGALVSRRIAEVYTALVGGGAVPEAVSSTVRRMVEVDRAYRSSEAFARDRAYWSARMADPPEPVGFGGRGQVVPSGRAVRCAAEFTREDTLALRSAARALGTGWPCVVYAAAAAYLHGVSGAEDIVVAMPVTGRTTPETREMRGFLSNVLPLRLAVHDAMSRAELVRATSVAIREALQHQRYRREDLLRDLGIGEDGRDLWGAEINIMSFDYDVTFAGAPASVQNLGVGPVDHLSVNLYDRRQGEPFTLQCEYDAARGSAEELAGHQRRFMAFLGAFARAGDEVRVGDLEVVTAAEQAWLLAAGDGGTAFVPDRTVHELFEAQAGRTPDAVAVCCGEERVSYRELDRRADAIAARLGGMTASEQRVGVCVERSADMVAALLGVLKAGCAYVPLDPALPAKRLRFIAQDAGVEVAVTRASLRERLPEDITTVLLGIGGGIGDDGTDTATVLLGTGDDNADAAPAARTRRVLPADAVPAAGTGGVVPADAVPAAGTGGVVPADAVPAAGTGGVVPADAVPAAGTGGVVPADAVPAAGTGGVVSADAVPAARARRVVPANAAYVLHTSGSTGRPKGVVVSHASAVNFVTQYLAAAGFGAADRCLGFAAVTFDVSVLEIFGSLLGGLTLVLATEEERTDADRLQALLREREVTVADLPTALMPLLDPARLPALRFLSVGGEAPSGDAVDRWRAPGRQVWNTYGPTETVVVVTMQHCAGPSHGRTPPIGRPTVNHRLYVVDRRLRLVPPGFPGELCVAGAGVARGYLGSPALTAQRFVADPWAVEPGARMYRTGDLVRWSAEGELEFLGRIDQQVKINGHRIELGEIETELARHPGVAQCAVLVKELPAAGRSLVAYVVGRDGTGVAAQDLQQHLAQELPRYMVPHHYVVVDELPLTASGKLDQAALAALAAPVSGPEPVERVSRTPREALLCSLFAEVLKVPSVGPHDNFFTRGGDSITAITLVSRARAAGIALSLREVFAHKTAAALAAAFPDTGQGAAGADAGFVRDGADAQGEVPLTPVMHMLRASGGPIGRFSQSVLLQVPAGAGRGPLVTALQTVLDHHDALRMRVRAGAGPADWTCAVMPAGSVDAAASFLRVGVAGLSGQDARETVERETQAALGRLDPVAGRMLQAVWFDAGERPGRLLLLLHHLVVDGVSWRILPADLAAAWEAAAAGRPAVLPAPTTAFRAWARHAQDLARAPETVAGLPHWTDVTAAAEPPLGSRRLDPGQDTVASAGKLRITLPDEVARPLLTALPAALGTGPQEILLAALVLAVHRRRVLRGERDVCDVLLDLEGHGRGDGRGGRDLTRTVGWFTTVYPLRVDLRGLGLDGATPAYGPLVQRVADALRRTPDAGTGYGLLRHLNPETAPQLAARSAPQILFNYLGRFETLHGDWLPAPEAGPLRADSDGAMALEHPLEVNVLAREQDQRLELDADWTWASGLLTAAEAAALADDWTAVLHQLAGPPNPTAPPGDPDHTAQAGHPDDTAPPGRPDDAASAGDPDGAVRAGRTDGTALPGDPDGPAPAGHPDPAAQAGHADGTAQADHPDPAAQAGDPDGTASAGRPDDTVPPGRTDGPAPAGDPDGTAQAGHPDGTVPPGRLDGTVPPGRLDGTVPPGRLDGAVPPGRLDDTAQAGGADGAVSAGRAPVPGDFPLVRLDQGALDGLLAGRPGVEDVLPLAPLQSGMYFHASFDERAVDAYTGQIILDLDGALDVAALRGACADVLRRHSALRAGFTDRGLPHAVQFVLREVEPPVVQADLSGLRPPQQQEALDRLLAEDRLRRFDLARPPLLRVTAVCLAPERYQLVLTNHHILWDGWSTPVILTELLDRYAARSAGGGVRPGRLAPARPFRSYLEWLQRQDRGRALEAWRRALDGLAAPTVLAGADPHRMDALPQRVSMELSVQSTARLSALARDRGLTLSSVVQGVWAILLSRLTGREDVVFGAVVSGRTPELEGVEAMVGLFINTLPVRFRVRPEESLAAALVRFQDEQAVLLDHQHVNLSDVQEAAGLGTLFDTAVAFENYPLDQDALADAGAGLRIAGVRATDATHYSVNLLVLPGPGLRFDLDHRPEVLDRAAAERLAGELRQLLTAVARDPDALVAQALPSGPPGARPALPPPALPPAAVPPAAVPSAAVPSAAVPSAAVPSAAVPSAAVPPAVFEAPASETEELIAAVWAEVLGLPRVGRQDNFFLCGGQSLKAMRVASRLRSSLDLDLPLRLVFEHPTLAALAEAVEAALLAELDGQPDAEAALTGSHTHGQTR